jgi:hypothetical protein
MKYLREFLESAPRPADRTDKSTAAPLLSVSSVARRPIPNASVAEVAIADAPSQGDTCAECGRPTWLALVADNGARTCQDCLSGRTALRRAGVPI